MLASKQDRITHENKTNKMAMMTLDPSPDPCCMNEMVGNIRWNGGFEHF